MAKIDEVLRKVVLEEWIEEISFSQARISNDFIEKTGLTSVRKEILAFLERAKQYAESKKPDFQPFSAIAQTEDASPVMPAGKSFDSH